MPFWNEENSAGCGSDRGPCSHHGGAYAERLKRSVMRLGRTGEYITPEVCWV